MTLRPPTSSDERLLAAFLVGDAEAFGVLVARYRAPIYNFLLRSVRDPQAAGALLQEVFLRVMERAEKFQGGAKFSTWIFTIARNQSVDHARGPDRPTGTDPGGDRTVEAPDLPRRIATAVETLPSEQREVLLMRQLHGLPFQDIADVVGVPVNTVKSRMRYALERLQQDLVEFEGHVDGLRQVHE